jgi:uncharacterized membrane protein (DUF2068 family)
MQNEAPARTLRSVKRDRALALIIAYKLVKGGAWLVLAVVVVVFMHLGLGSDLLGLAEHLKHHSRAWSIALAEVLVRAASRRGLWTVAVALVLDGTSSLVEGWALAHGAWWGPWLVVVATGSFLPVEVVTLVRHPHVSRAILLAVNLAIVVYLARKALRERRARGVEGAPHAERLGPREG